MNETNHIVLVVDVYSDKNKHLLERDSLPWNGRIQFHRVNIKNDFRLEGILLLTFISSSDLNQPTGATIMPPPEVHNTTMKVGPKTASCATVEDMGNDSFGDSWKESLRVRRLIRNHFDIHGGYVPNHLVVEHLQSHGYSVTWGKYPFGDYITYADFTFTLPEVKHLWRKNDCVRKYGRHLVMRADDFEKPSETNVSLYNWRKWKHPIIWFKGTTDAVASQFFLKNVMFQMRKSASTLFGSTGCLRSRPNVIGELLRVMISPSPDVQRIVNWVVNEGRDPHIAVHMRMLMNRSLRAVTTVLNCIKTTIARFPKDVVRPRVVLISDTKYKQSHDDLDSPTNFSFISSFQNNLLHRGLQNQVGWGHVWNRFAGQLSCHSQPNQCALTPLLPPGWWDGLWQSPIPRDIRRMEAYGVKLSSFGTIDDNRLQAYCKAKKAIVRTIPITHKCIGLKCS
ncbi:hypothetical protein Tco_1531669 [Tanacetum coccineum]